jgi:hypothetical protein
MAYVELIWDLDDDPEGNVMHIAQHGLTKDEVANALATAYHESLSRSTGQSIAFGIAEDGREVAVVFEVVDEVSIYPITAYEV